MIRLLHYIKRSQWFKMFADSFLKLPKKETDELYFDNLFVWLHSHLLTVYSWAIRLVWTASMLCVLLTKTSKMRRIWQAKECSRQSLISCTAIGQHE